jgi:hypothetical protein
LRCEKRLKIEEKYETRERERERERERGELIVGTNRGSE